MQIASSSPSFNKLPGPTPLLLSEPRRRGFYVESNGNHVKSPRLKPNIPFPLCPHINTSAPNRQSLAVDSDSSFFISRFRQFRRRPKRPRDDPRSHQTQGRQHRRRSHIGTGSRPDRRSTQYMGRCRFTRPGRGAQYPPPLRIYPPTKP